MGAFDHIVAAIEASRVSVALREMTEANDFSRLESGAKRHHFLPQFLLRGFADPRGRQDSIFQLDVRNRRAPKRVGIQTAASRRRLYTVPDENGRPSNRNEGYLALVETHAAPAIRRLTDDITSITAAERATVAYFLALQTMRTPVAAADIEATANHSLRAFAGEMFSDRSAFAIRYREHYGAGATETEIEAFREEVLAEVREGGVTIGGHEAAMSTALVEALRSVPVIFAFDWTLLRARSGGVITSDRGFAIDDPSPPFPWAAQGLLSSDRAETTIPIGDTICLAIRPGEADAGMDERKLSVADLERLNLRTYGWADSYVFAARQDHLDRVRVAARRWPDRAAGPRPFCSVALIELDPEDDSLARENQRRGWPAHLRGDDGRGYDYIVIPADKPHPDLHRRADELAEARARKRAGIDPDVRIDGSISTRLVHPLDIYGPR